MMTHRYTTRSSTVGRASRPPELTRTHTRPAFTLIELLVAISATILLLGIVGVAFNHARDAMGLGVASATINTQAKALESNLRRDIQQLSTDAFLAIRSVDVSKTDEATGITKTYEADQLMFFANGAFTSAQRTNPGVAPIQATAAWITYGHLINLNEPPPNRFDQPSAPRKQRK